MSKYFVQINVILIISEDMDLGEDDGEECKDPTDIKCILKGVSEVGKSSEKEKKSK